MWEGICFSPSLCPPRNVAFLAHVVRALAQTCPHPPPLFPWSQVWEEQVAAFLTEVVRAPAVLVGNSIGSLTSLMVRGHVNTILI